MKMRRLLFSEFIGLTAFCAVVLLSGTAWAQNPGSVNQAFAAARQAVSPALQTKVVSVYGIGTPTAIQKWYIIFYDPSVPSHGRAVLVENNQINKTYPANGGTTYAGDLTFDPSRVTSEGPVLSAAQTYAAQHHIAYDSVRALLKQTAMNKPFRWKVELVSGDKSHGFVYVSALDDTVASYQEPNGDKGGSSDGGFTGFSHTVQKTFLGIGGTLQQFFTGERTIDR